MAEPRSPVLGGFEAREVEYAETQPQYQVLPALKKADGTVLMRVEFTHEERELISLDHDLFVEVLTFNHPLQPMRFVVADRDADAQELGEGY